MRKGIRCELCIKGRWFQGKESIREFVEFVGGILDKKLEQLFESPELLERLAALEHEQWVLWSRAVAEEVREERRARWEQLWRPYDELPEHMKEEDRRFARKVLDVFREEVR